MRPITNPASGPADTEQGPPMGDDAAHADDGAEGPERHDAGQEEGEGGGDPVAAAAR